MTKSSKRIKFLLKEWYDDCCMLSSSSTIQQHENAQEIVDYGWEAVRILIEELENYPHEVFPCLHKITNQNPIKYEHRGNVPKMILDWQNWAKKNKL